MLPLPPFALLLLLLLALPGALLLGAGLHSAGTLGRRRGAGLLLTHVTVQIHIKFKK